MDFKRQLLEHYGNGEGNALWRMVMEECFSLSQTDLLLGKDKQLSRNDQLKLEEIALRLLKDEPIQYILGYTEFCGHRFEVRQGCLIPRPETEELVRLVIADYAKANAKAKAKANANANTVSVLDIGTGSGCIAVSLALEGFEVTAMDVSLDALEIAKNNAERFGVEVEFLHENILHPISFAPKHAKHLDTEKWDAIVSNPPYVCQREKAFIHKNVLEYEPHLALFVPDEDPLLFYRAIARYGRMHLNEGGVLYFEINQAFGKETSELLAAEGYHEITIRKDQYGKERIAKAHL